MIQTQNELKENNHQILLATVGRYHDTMKMKINLKIDCSSVSMIVIEHMDRILDLGMSDMLIEVVEDFPNAQIVVGSARSKDVIKFLNDFIPKFVEIQVPVKYY